MAIFPQCSITLSDARADVAQSSGDQGDTEMETLAYKAIRQAIERWNHYHPWVLLLNTADDIGVDSSLGQDYLLPPDFGMIYNVKSAANSRNLRPLTQREYDWADPFAQPGTPTHYGLYRVGAVGKIRLYPTPAGGDRISVKYYRRLNIPMQSVAVGSSTTSASDVTLTGCTLVSGSTTLTSTSTNMGNIYVGAVLANANITAGTTVVRINSSTELVMSAAATGSASAQSVTVGLNLLQNSTAGAFNNVRIGAPVSGTGVAAGTTVYRIITPTSLVLSAPTTSAINTTVTFDSSSTLLDIPADWERGVIAQAKYYYLTDKGGDSQRIQGWRDEADRALSEAKGKDNMVTDDLLGFQPGYLAPQVYYPLNPNDVRWAWSDW